MSFEFLFTIWRFAISAKLLLSKRPLCQLIRIFVYSLVIVAVNRHFCHFSPKSPLSKGPLCQLIWIFVYILAINRHFRHFCPNCHFPKGPFAISFEFLFTFWRLIVISDIFANSCISEHILWFAQLKATASMYFPAAAMEQKRWQYKYCSPAIDGSC